MTFRDIKKKSRRDLHNHMKVAAAVYVGGALGFGVEDRREVSVRVHNKNVNAGDLAGTSLGYAEVREDAPKIVFDLVEYQPARGDVVIVEADEAYRLQVPDEDDGEFQTVSATRLSDTEAALYTAP